MLYFTAQLSPSKERRSSFEVPTGGAIP